MAAMEPFQEAEHEFQKGDFKKSIQLYTLAIELDPKNAHYISQRGVAFFRIGQHEESLYDLNRALQLEPDNPYRYSSRAFILSNLNKIDEAILDYEKAIKLDPEDAIAYNNLGLLHEKKGYQSKAKKLYNKADSLEGIKPKTTQNPPYDLRSSSNSDSSYKNLNYWQYVGKVFTDNKVRNDFFRFLRNGFKVK